VARIPQERGGAAPGERGVWARARRRRRGEAPEPGPPQRASGPRARARTAPPNARRPAAHTTSRTWAWLYPWPRGRTTTGLLHLGPGLEGGVRRATGGPRGRM